MPYLGRNPDKGNFSDLNGAKLIIDADADTSITADTDDQIDIEIAGADDFQFTANTFTVLSGSTLTVASGATIANSGTATGFGGSDPDSADGDSLGTASAEWSDLFLADGGIIYFGNDQEITLTHSADSGLLLKHTATADDKPINLVLQTGETDMAADDVIGKISFQAPDEGTGTDAVLVAAAIQARSEGNFSSSANATSIDFLTGASEAAASKMSITSGGDVNVLTDGASLFFGADSEIELRHVADDGLILKHVGTGDGKEPSFTFQAGDNDIAADDVLGSILFQAPDEGAGTDAILVAAGIQAVSEGDFSSSNNATKLQFMTGASEAAAVKWSIESGGLFRGIDGAGILVGKSAGAAVEFGGSTPTLQVLGTAQADSTIGVGRWSADAVGPRFIGIKSRHSGVGSTAIVNDGDTLLDIVGYADDAASDYYEAPGAMIRMAVDGSPGTNDMPGRMTFHTSQDGGQALEERLRINYHGDMCLGDTTNGSTTLGFTVNQAAADNSAFALKSSDVAHGQTSALITSETDTFFQIEKSNSAYGGSRLGSLAENACTTNMSFHAVGTTPATSPSTSAAASFAFHGRPHNDSNGTANYAANALVFSVVGFVGGTDRRIWFVDEDGDTHADGTHNNTVFDEYDDALVCRSLDLMRSPKNVIKSEFDNWTKDHRKILEDVGVISKLDPSMPEYWDQNGDRARPMLNTSQLQRLHNGAIWQQRAMFETMKKVVDKMLPGFSEKLNEELEAQNLPALPG